MLDENSSSGFQDSKKTKTTKSFKEKKSFLVLRFVFQ